MNIIRPEQRHRQEWDRLYRGYAEFYKFDQTAAMRDRVWSWLHDPAHTVKGFLAIADSGTPVGLAHYRPFARPLVASTGGFLDDLFVDPTHRGGGVADALIKAVADEGRMQGWTVIRWITAENNYRARAVYDRLATKTVWATYDLKL
jgi:GNAT superfamily N-acetyltransferase